MQMILRSNSRKLYLVQQQVLTGKVAEKQTVETLDSGRFCVLISASSKPLLLDPVLNQSSMLKALHCNFQGVIITPLVGLI